MGEISLKKTALLVTSAILIAVVIEYALVYNDWSTTVDAVIHWYKSNYIFPSITAFAVEAILLFFIQVPLVAIQPSRPKFLLYTALVGILICSIKVVFPGYGSLFASVLAVLTAGILGLIFYEYYKTEQSEGSTEPYWIFISIKLVNFISELRKQKYDSIEFRRIHSYQLEIKPLEERFLVKFPAYKKVRGPAPEIGLEFIDHSFSREPESLIPERVSYQIYDTKWIAEVSGFSRVIDSYDAGQEEELRLKKLGWSFKGNPFKAFNILLAESVAREVAGSQEELIKTFLKQERDKLLASKQIVPATKTREIIENKS